MDKENYFRPERKLDKDLQRELDEALGDMNLGDIIDAEDNLHAPAGGQQENTSGIRKGTVVAVNGDDIFLDVGGRSEGLLPAGQFGDDEPLPKEGDVIEVVIERYDTDAGILRLSREGAVQAATWDTLEQGQMVEARVTGHNKGGLEVVFNGIQAFMPISQIDIYRVEQLEPYLNQRLDCEVTEINYAEQRVIVSRREFLKKEAQKQAEKFWETIHEGMVVPGRVRSIMPYGAFVDIGGLDGLLHIKDMSYSRVEKPQDIVHDGQEIEVRILGFDRDERKISLGLKQTQPDPWEAAEVKWPVGSTVTARITRLADFGAFAELEPGVEGLVPISELSFRRIAHPRETVAPGDVLRLNVLNVDMEKKRIGLSLKQAGDDPWVGASVRWAGDTIVAGTVTRLAEFGAFVELAPGVEGLIHISELDHKRVQTVGSVVQEGQGLQVKVLEVDEERRRISLSLKQASAEPGHAEEQKPPLPGKKHKTGNKHLKGGLEAPGGGGGLADLKLR